MASGVDKYIQVNNINKNATSAKAQQYLAAANAQKYAKQQLANQGLQNTGIGANKEAGITTSYLRSVENIERDRMKQLNDLQAQQNSDRFNQWKTSMSNAVNSVDGYSIGQGILKQAQEGGATQEQLQDLQNQFYNEIEAPYNYGRAEQQALSEMQGANTTSEKQAVLDKYKNSLSKVSYDNMVDAINASASAEERANYGIGVEDEGKDFNAIEVGGTNASRYIAANNGIFTLKNGNGELTNITLKNGDVVDLDKGVGKAYYTFYNGKFYKTSNSGKVDYDMSSKRVWKQDTTNNSEPQTTSGETVLIPQKVTDKALISDLDFKFRGNTKTSGTTVTYNGRKYRWNNIQKAWFEVAK